MKFILDGLLNLRFLTGYRTTVIGVVIAGMGIWQGLALRGTVPAIAPELYVTLQALLIERLSTFAKEHE